MRHQHEESIPFWIQKFPKVATHWQAPFRVLPHQGALSVEQIVFSNNSKMFATVYSGGHKIDIWEVDTAALIHSHILSPAEIRGAVVACIQFLPDDSTIVFIGPKGVVEHLDIVSKEIISQWNPKLFIRSSYSKGLLGREFKGNRPLRPIALDAQGKTLLCVSNKNQALVFDIRPGNQDILWQFKIPTLDGWHCPEGRGRNEGSGITLSPDGESVFFLFVDDEVHNQSHQSHHQKLAVHSLVTGTSRMVEANIPFGHHSSDSRLMAFFKHNGRFLVRANSYWAEVYDLELQRPLMYWVGDYRTLEASRRRQLEFERILQDNEAELSSMHYHKMPRENFRYATSIFLQPNGMLHMQTFHMHQ